MLHKNIIKLSALLWCVLTVASCTNEDFDKGNNGPDVPEGLPVTLKLNIGAPDVTVVETKALDNGETFGQISMPRPAITRSMCWQMSVLKMLQKNIQRNKLCYPNKLNLKNRWEQK